MSDQITVKIIAKKDVLILEEAREIKRKLGVKCLKVSSFNRGLQVDNWKYSRFR